SASSRHQDRYGDLPPQVSPSGRSSRRARARYARGCDRPARRGRASGRAPAPRTVRRHGRRDARPGDEAGRPPLPATGRTALRRPLARSPIALAWPLHAALGERFGPRGDRFHTGVDLPAPLGTPVGAAASGRVVFIGWADGWGKLVAIEHPSGVRTLYAHLSQY